MPILDLVRRGRSLPLLGLLVVLITLLACSPRPLLRFVRDLVTTAPKAPPGEALFAHARSAGKGARLKAVAPRSFRLSRHPAATDAPPAWPRGQDAPLPAAPPPVHGAPREDSADPAYLKPFLRSGFGSTPAPPL